MEAKLSHLGPLELKSVRNTSLELSGPSHPAHFTLNSDGTFSYGHDGIDNFTDSFTPATYPACEINGVLISGFVSSDISKAVYPSLLIPRLKDMD